MDRNLNKYKSGLSLAGGLCLMLGSVLFTSSAGAANRDMAPVVNKAAPVQLSYYHHGRYHHYRGHRWHRGYYHHRYHHWNRWHHRHRWYRY